MEFVHNLPNQFGVVPVDIHSSGVVLSTSVFMKSSPIQRSKHRRFRTNASPSPRPESKNKQRKATQKSAHLIETSGVFISIPNLVVPRTTVAVPEEDDVKETMLLRALRCQPDPSVQHVFQNTGEDERFFRGIFDNSYMSNNKLRNRISKATLEKLCSPKGGPAPGGRPSPRPPPGSAHHPRAWRDSMSYFPKPPPGSGSTNSLDAARRRKPLTAPGRVASSALGLVPHKPCTEQPFLAPPLVDRYADFSTPVTATNIVPLEELGRGAFTPVAPVATKKVSPRPGSLQGRVSRKPVAGNSAAVDVTPADSPAGEPRPESEAVPAPGEVLGADSGPVGVRAGVGGAQTPAMLACVQTVSASTVHCALANALQNLLARGGSANAQPDGDSAVEPTTTCR
jgi:hypothetical protein